METALLPDKKGLRLKFALLYILSAALIVFIAWVFIPKVAPANMVAARPLDDKAVQADDLLRDVNVLNAQYKELKQLDQEYASKVVDDAPANDLAALKSTITAAEVRLLKKIDSLDAIALTYSDQQSSGVLRNFTESFRLVTSDHSSMQAYKTAVPVSDNPDENKQALYNMQNEVQARDSRITALESQIRTLSANKPNTKVDVNAATSTNQAALANAEATISEQDRKITSLMASNASLEKEIKTVQDALEQAKRSTDNTSSAATKQVAVLEKRLNELNTDVRLAQIDCNLARADVTQIISNAKQRRALLSDALNTLNTLGATGDANIRKKVAEKVTRLNQIASTLRD